MSRRFCVLFLGILIVFASTTYPQPVPRERPRNRPAPDLQTGQIQRSRDGINIGGYTFDAVMTLLDSTSVSHDSADVLSVHYPDQDLAVLTTPFKPAEKGYGYCALEVMDGDLRGQLLSTVATQNQLFHDVVMLPNRPLWYGVGDRIAPPESNSTWQLGFRAVTPGVGGPNRIFLIQNAALVDSFKMNVITMQEVSYAFIEHGTNWTYEFRDKSHTEGDILRNGIRFTDSLGVDEAFGYRILDGREFYFVRKEGVVGYVFDGTLHWMPWRKAVCFNPGQGSYVWLMPELSTTGFALQVQSIDGWWHIANFGLLPRDQAAAVVSTLELSSEGLADHRTRLADAVPVWRLGQADDPLHVYAVGSFDTLEELRSTDAGRAAKSESGLAYRDRMDRIHTMLSRAPQTRIILNLQHVDNSVKFPAIDGGYYTVKVDGGNRADTPKFVDLYRGDTILHQWNVPDRKHLPWGLSETYDGWFISVLNDDNTLDVLINGESLAEREGVLEVTGFALINLKPFFFYRTEDGWGCSYNGVRSGICWQHPAWGNGGPLPHTLEVKDSALRFGAKVDGTWTWIYIVPPESDVLADMVSDVPSGD